MRVAIAGGHGKIALLLARLLADRGDAAVGLIRNREHAEDVRAAGAEPVLCDLEAVDDVAAAVAGSDAVVFASPASAGRAFVAVNGDTPIEQALTLLS